MSFVAYISIALLMTVLVAGLAIGAEELATKAKHNGYLKQLFSWVLFYPFINYLTNETAHIGAKSDQKAISTFAMLVGEWPIHQTNLFGYKTGTLYEDRHLINTEKFKSWVTLESLAIILLDVILHLAHYFVRLFMGLF